MAASLNPYKEASGWRLYLPAAISPSGKVQKLRFKTKAEAFSEAKRIKDHYKMWGTAGGGRVLSAADNYDAHNALKILDGQDVSLTDLANMYMESIKQRSESITFERLWFLHTCNKEKRSDDYRKQLGILGRKLIPLIGDKLLWDLDTKAMQKVMDAQFEADSVFNYVHRTVSPAFNFAVKKGWCKSNPFKSIPKREMARHEIKFLTIKQASAVMDAAADYTKRMDLPSFMRYDMREATAALAIMLFAGVRPGETKRLHWGDLDLEEGTLRVSNLKAKTNRSRFIELPETCRAWLATVEPKEDSETIVPANWGNGWRAIRHVAGISNMNDVLRHTFATYHLAAFGDVNLTRSVMGHEIGDMLFKHYRGVVRKSDGLAFWKILPSDTDRQ